MGRTGAAAWPNGRREGVMLPHPAFPGWAKVGSAVLDATVLAIACLITYLLVTRALSRLYFISKDDDLLGGMWAVIATIFVMRDSYRHSVAAAASRTAATLVSFLICLIYLLFLPFHSWALVVLIGASALIVTLIGRPEDAVTAAITTAVVIVLAAVSPQHAWQQPILRFADTVVGVTVGVAAAWKAYASSAPGSREAANLAGHQLGKGAPPDLLSLSAIPGLPGP
jgi:Fusaric acid resistance protein-like